MNVEIIYKTIIRDAMAFYNSSAFSVIKFILGIYVIVVLADIILLLVKRGVGGNIREMVIGMDIPKELATKKDKMRIRWGKIRKRLETGNESEYKVAVIEADNVIDELLKRMGYKGENLSERLDNIPPGQIENIDGFREAHKVRNRIIHEEGFKLAKESAEAILGTYEKFLKEFEVLD